MARVQAAQQQRLWQFVAYMLLALVMGYMVGRSLPPNPSLQLFRSQQAQQQQAPSTLHVAVVQMAPSSSPAPAGVEQQMATTEPSASAQPAVHLALKRSAREPRRPPKQVSHYRETQVKATPFPSDYASALVLAAQAANIQVPDILERSRIEAAAMPECPPHAAGAPGLPGTFDFDAHGMGGPVPVVDTKGMPVLALPQLGRYTLGLALQSHNSPTTLANTLRSYAESGLLDLMDDLVVFLSAPIQAEIDLALSYGFRVYTADPAETEPIKARNMEFLAQFNKEDLKDQWKAFPHSRNVEKDPALPPRYATYIGPSQAVMYMEMATDFVLFAERDFALPSNLPEAQLIRYLLASVASLATGTQAVKLRRVDDPNRDGIPNCCQMGCVGKFTDFGGKCHWRAHLDWLAYLCDRDGIEQRSKGQARVCLDEGKSKGQARLSIEHRATVDPADPVPLLNPDHFMPAEKEGPEKLGEPLSMYCFSSNHASWSNNVAMFGRRWWLETVGHVGILSGPSNGDFEVNAVLWCDYARRNKLGSGPAADVAPRLCQLDPGLFFHVELEV